MDNVIQLVHANVILDSLGSTVINVQQATTTTHHVYHVTLQQTAHQMDNAIM